jgi:hypothetical protein
MASVMFRDGAPGVGRRLCGCLGQATVTVVLAASLFSCDGEPSTSAAAPHESPSSAPAQTSEKGKNASPEHNSGGGGDNVPPASPPRSNSEDGPDIALPTESAPTHPGNVGLPLPTTSISGPACPDNGAFLSPSVAPSPGSTDCSIAGSNSPPTP